MTTQAELRPRGRSGGIPRGLATGGIPLLAYGFRPFFLGAGVFAALAMGLWIGALVVGWEVGGSTYGALHWHAHEMLFGYASAALAGFMLTAIPNWTGRLPVSGMPLLALAALWLAGRVVMLSPDLFGLYPATIIDAAFFPALAVIAGREIIAGKNWKNLKILVALALLAGLNIGFHALVLNNGEAMAVLRAAVAVFVALIAIVGGRIVPSFTRNWLSKASATRLPAPFGELDRIAIAALIIALLAWSAVPEGVMTAVLCGTAALLQAWRLARWRGASTLSEPLLLILHIAYAFISFGMGAIAMTALGWLSPPASLHILTVGAIGTMTLAIMTRATLGHTGRPLTASLWTSIAYVAVVVSAAARPFAEILPAQYHLVLALSAATWILAFTLFSVEYGRFLSTPKVEPLGHTHRGAARLGPLPRDSLPTVSKPVVDSPRGLVVE